MVIFAVDVNVTDLKHLERSIKEVYEDAKVVLHPFVDAESAIKAIEEARPQYAVIEAELANVSGIALAKQIKGSFPSIKVDITNDSDEYAYYAFQIHANGYLLKPVTAEKIKKYL